MITKEKMQEEVKSPGKWVTPPARIELMKKIEGVAKKHNIEVSLKRISLFLSSPLRMDKGYRSIIYDLVQLMRFINASSGVIFISDSKKGSFKEKIKFQKEFFISTNLYNYLNEQLVKEIEFLAPEYGIDREDIDGFSEEEIRMIFDYERKAMKIKYSDSEVLGHKAKFILRHFDKSSKNYKPTKLEEMQLQKGGSICCFANDVTGLTITSKYNFIWDLFYIAGWHSYDNSGSRDDKYHQVRSWITAINQKLRQEKNL